MQFRVSKTPKMSIWVDTGPAFSYAVIYVCTLVKHSMVGGKTGEANVRGNFETVEQR